MEGCPRLPAIDFDLKLSIESVNLCEKIEKYIVSHYQENSDNYRKEYEQINELRQNAIRLNADESNVQYLKRYYGQLLLLKNRFPMLSNNECSVRFVWEDAFQGDDTSSDDVRFEETNILYNLGAVYSKLGAKETKKNHESLKAACSYSRYSAACFEKIRDQYPTYSIDLTTDLLTAQVDILMGQAHEAVLEKSQIDHRPASVNSHISMKISEFFRAALKNLTKSDVQSICSRSFREWRVNLTFKSIFYAALTYFYSGLVAEENKKHGEAVCYFENAVEQLKDAWKSASKISNDKTSVFKEIQNFTLQIFTEKLRTAKRDNDTVFFEKVPSLTSLPLIQGVVVAKPHMFDFQDVSVSGADIFQRLVPMSVHLAMSEYSEEKAKLLRQVLQLVEIKDEELEKFISSLEMGKMPLTNEYLRLPRDFLDCSSAVATRPSMSRDLTSSMTHLNNRHHEIVEQLSRLKIFLENLREHFPTCSTNDEFVQIEQQIEYFGNLMLRANDTNVDLQRHAAATLENLALLQAPLENVEQTLPKIVELEDENLKGKFARLGLLLEKVETTKVQRQNLLDELRKKLHDDDIAKLILMQKEENFPSLFSSQIKKHEEIVGLIKENCRGQENLFQSIDELKNDLSEVRTKIVEKFENRQKKIRDCVQSFRCFEEIFSKISDGIEFYKKQEEKLESLFSMEKKLENSLKIDRPRLKDFLPQFQQTKTFVDVEIRPRAQLDLQSIYYPSNYAPRNQSASAAAYFMRQNPTENFYIRKNFNQ